MAGAAVACFVALVDCQECHSSLDVALPSSVCHDVQGQAKSEAARRFGRDSMFVLQAIEEAENIETNDVLPAYMSDRSLWIFPANSFVRRLARKILAFWYYQVSPCNDPAPTAYMAGISQHIHQSGHPFPLGLYSPPHKKR